MTIEKFFMLDIDLDVLESIAYRWGLQDKSIQKIQFYAGVGNKPVLLFSFSAPAIGGFWGYCMNGLRDWQSGWFELKEAYLRDNTQDMRNWLIFAHDESENQYMTSEYCWRNGKNDDPSKIWSEFTSDDFVDDSWILMESGFKKHILDVAPKTLYQKVTVSNNENLSIPVPEGTTWDQIKFRYVNDNHIEIKHPGEKTHAPYSMDTLGFSKKRELRDIFEMFATFRGDIKPKDMKPFRANISNLRKHLKELFPGIEGKPIKNYNQKDGYCCEFKITKS